MTAPTAYQIYEVGHTDVKLAGLDLPPGGSFAGAIAISTDARIYYPAESAGANANAARVPDGFPGLTFTHGRLYSVTDNITETNHLRATALLEQIVSNGFVVISINMTVVDRFQSYLMKARAVIVNAGLRYLKSNDIVGGVALSDLVNGARLGTLGHSRGGAAAVAADHYAEDDIRIGAIGSLSPVDGNEIATSAPLFILYGALDDDVSSGDPVQIFERCTGEKSFAYLDGASHFHFTDDLTVDIPVLSREKHADVAGAYFAGFFLKHLKSDPNYDDLLTGDLKVDDDVNVAFQYASGRSRTIDDFSTEISKPNRLGGSRSATGFAQAISGQALNLPQLGFFGGVQSGLVLAWGDGSSPFYETTFPPLEMLVTQVLTFRLSQLRSVGVSPLIEDLPVIIRVTDDQGASADVNSAETGFNSRPFASRNPYWQAPRDVPAGTLVYVQTARKDVFSSMRLPVSLFRSQNSALNLSKVVSISMSFPDGPGAVIIDDLGVEEGVNTNV